MKDFSRLWGGGAVPSCLVLGPGMIYCRGIVAQSVRGPVKGVGLGVSFHVGRFTVLHCL